MTESDPRYHEGIRLFNECEFHEAHDQWEEIWADYHGQDRNFYKGLIQVAVCLHHFGNENIHGARKLYITSTKYLEPFRPFHEGVDLDKLLSELERCCKEIFEGEEEQWRQARIVPDLIPEIHLESRDG